MADNDLDRVWKLIEKHGIAVLTTLDGTRLRSRPMGVWPRRDEDAIYLLTDVSSHKDDEIDASPEVSLAFSGGSSYVAVSGRATVTNDRARIRELWSPIAKAWWDGPDDPAIRLLTIMPESAQFWDTPGKIVAYVEMIAAAVTGAKPKIGETGKVAM